MKKIALVTFLALLLSACVSTKNTPLSTSDINKIEFKKITISSRGKPDFAALTAGKALFGGLGAIATISAGNKIISDNDVEDPAGVIGSALAKLLSEKHQIADIGKSDTSVKGLKTKSLLDAYPNSGLLVDVQTINWSFGYFPTKWGKYRVIYSAKLKLIDSNSGVLLAEGFCKRIPKYDETAPSKDELLSDSAARLKAELVIAADSCIDQLKTNVLQL